MNGIEVLVIEFTNKSNLNPALFPQNKKINFFKSSLLKKILNSNNELGNSIKYFELHNLGNSKFHKKLEKILKAFKSYDCNVSILTNGFNLKDIVGYLEDELLKNINFSIYFDSADEEKNDSLVGIKKAFKKTIESMEYLIDRNLHYNILMKICSKNYNEIEDMLNVGKFYKFGLLIPIEMFPFVKDKSLLLTDEMKSQVIATINGLKNSGKPIYKAIQFEHPSCSCTYLRNKRMFITSKGKLSFCHFLSSIENTNICDAMDKSLIKLIEINNEIRNNFVKNKEKELKNWKFTKNTASPCSYCLYKFGVREVW